MERLSVSHHDDNFSWSRVLPTRAAVTNTTFHVCALGPTVGVREVFGFNVRGWIMRVSLIHRCLGPAGGQGAAVMTGSFGRDGGIFSFGQRVGAGLVSIWLIWSRPLNGIDMLFNVLVIRFITPRTAVRMSIMQEEF